MTEELVRCFGDSSDPLIARYHDEEWGVPLHDDRGLFEFLVLDSFQAGLSWRTILHKRENFHRAFHNFDAAKIALYTDEDRQRLLNDAGIVRNRLKIAITNAQGFLEVQKEFGSFDKYFWQFTGHKTLRNPEGVTNVYHAGLHKGVGRHVQGLEGAGVPLCGDDYLLRDYPVRGDGQRPHSRLYSRPGPG
jgi:DNA-3-methyladenine glycosylase I